MCITVCIVCILPGLEGDGDGLLAMLMPTVGTADGGAGEAMDAALSTGLAAQPESPSRQSLELAAVATSTDIGSSASMDLSASHAPLLCNGE